VIANHLSLVSIAHGVPGACRQPIVGLTARIDTAFQTLESNRRRPHQGDAAYQADLWCCFRDGEVLVAVESCGLDTFDEGATRVAHPTLRGIMAVCVELHSARGRTQAEKATSRMLAAKRTYVAQLSETESRGPTREEHTREWTPQTNPDTIHKHLGPMKTPASSEACQRVGPESTHEIQTR
jgi:hypothetical protein